MSFFRLLQRGVQLLVRAQEVLLVISRLYHLFEELSNELVVAKFATTSQHGAIEGKSSELAFLNTSN